MKLLLTLFLVILFGVSHSQKSIDSSFSFQSDPAKKVSIYIPSSYNSSQQNPLMLALHPWNVSRWNAQSWRDTLISFAESNNLILLCPDGGADGQVDDPIDIEFTSAMLDSIALWYNIDSKRSYCMGFSWGGKTTYTYGLRNIQRFCGLMPIGAAVNIREVSFMQDSIKDKPVYIVHGSNDSPNDRFTPLRDAMVNGGGIVNTLLMNGVGHTIDFPNRNQILGSAYQWIDSVCTYDPSTGYLEMNQEQFDWIVYPNPAKPGSSINLSRNGDLSSVQILDMTGKVIFKSESNSALIAPKKPGSYIVRINSGMDSQAVLRLSVTN